MNLKTGIYRFSSVLLEFFISNYLEKNKQTEGEAKSQSQQEGLKKAVAVAYKATAFFLRQGSNQYDTLNNSAGP